MMEDSICIGENCPVKMTCFKYLRWMSSEEDEADFSGNFGEDCSQYEQREYYGG